ncbi:hypothetical protein FQN54_003233 [Arachnomyces sp. PD_36]|nr:hypothetical protein FQN54_003233 [Arachnomyces sp. PD_36]
MRFTTAVAALSMCGSLVAAQGPFKIHHLPKRHMLTTGGKLAAPVSLNKRQSETCFDGGSCADCFGSGYIECDNDSSVCWDPSTQSESVACSGSSGSSPAPTPSSFPGVPDICSSGGSCSDCFGDGYIECPNDDFYCYDPATQDLDVACDTGSSGSSGSGSSPSSTASPTSSSDSPFPSISVPSIPEYCSDGGSCEDCFGEGSTLCPGSESDCYKPDEGSVSQLCPEPTSTGAASHLVGSNSLMATVFGLLLAAL